MPDQAPRDILSMLCPFTEGIPLAPARRRPAGPSARGRLIHPTTSALRFQAFSLWEPGHLGRRHVPREQTEAFEEFLAECYGAVELFYTEPFLVIGCEAALLPPEGERPFTVAGLVAVWRAEDDMSFMPLVGALSPRWDHSVDVDPEAVARMARRGVVPRDVADHLAGVVFPDCEAITVFGCMLVVELPRTSAADFAARLAELPGGINGAPFSLTYYNGPLPPSERVGPAGGPAPPGPGPARLDGGGDRTDYVRRDGRFYPGVMVRPAGGDGEARASTAGVLVEKGQARRLVCSARGWGDALGGLGGTAAGEQPGSALRVVQGTSPGTAVGTVAERVGHFALARLDGGAAFENRSAGTGHAPRVLLPSGAQRHGDQYVADAFPAGPLPLRDVGGRFRVRRGRHPACVAAGDPGPAPHVTRVEPAQKILVANRPVAARAAEGACGAVLLRSGASGAPGGGEGAAARGELGGVVRLPGAGGAEDVPGCFVESHMVFADTFDALLEEGWSVAGGAAGEME